MLEQLGVTLDARGDVEAGPDKQARVPSAFVAVDMRRGRTTPRSRGALPYTERIATELSPYRFSVSTTAGCLRLREGSRNQGPFPLKHRGSRGTIARLSTSDVGGTLLPRT